MILGGPIDGSGWGWFFAGLGALALLALIGLGVLAGTIAGRAWAGLLALAVFATTLWSLAVVGDASAEAAIALGAVLAIASAVLLRVPDAGPDRLPPRWRRRVPAVATVAILAAIALALVVGTRSADRDAAADATRWRADSLAARLEEAGPSPSSATDLALSVAPPSGGPLSGADLDVVDAEGDRDRGGANLVVRIRTGSGSSLATACWRFEVATGAPVRWRPVGCPASAVEVPSNYDDRLFQPIAALPIEAQTDADAVRHATAATLVELLGEDAAVEVAQVGDGTVGVAASLDPLHCVITTVQASDLGGTSIASAWAPVDALRTDGIGCRASLAG